MSEVISSFKRLRAGSQAFALLMLSLCVMFVKKYVASVYVGGYGCLSGSGLCVFRELCPVSFLVVGESLSVLL